MMDLTLKTLEKQITQEIVTENYLELCCSGSQINGSMVAIDNARKIFM